MSDNELEFEGGAGLFEEPEGYFKPEIPPSFDHYDRLPEFIKDGQPSKIVLRLVGKSPLWGHFLWNASKVTANYLEEHASTLLVGKTVLELGAGAGLPSFIAGVHNASKVVITDYPEIELIDNIEYNVEHVEGIDKSTFRVQGYIWGADVSNIMEELPEGADGYDLVILSDVVFNHSEHAKLLQTCHDTLSHKNKDAKVFVVFTPHRARLVHRDFQFFEDAKAMGFKVEKLFEQKWWPMFVEEESTKDIRSMVYGYFLSF
ncbi:putative methyltransferase-domain-containing protein [Limtongia smithiae]|uniref:putative methyltransferase-domain-containing protein n=1 Tax=Limtongia smithiae TaxID=1125753 RepID=UPI0034CDF9B2